jgi:1,4-alpha-glucan branching enzyme
LQHQHRLTPSDPQPDQPVTLTVEVGSNLDADQIACYYTLDGGIPTGSKGIAGQGHVVMLEKVEVTWDTAAWGYSIRWKGTLPAQPAGTVVRYQIGAWAGDSAEVFADWPVVKAAAEQAASAFFKGQPLPQSEVGNPHKPYTFTYHVDSLQPPLWAYSTVIYHVFVDRFYPGDGNDWLQTSDLDGFCGGTLWGVLEKLGYIADLGADCIWLSPVFVSPSHHGYDATDYNHVEPRLGGDDALRALVQAAHTRGIRILLDLACNHTSNQHPIFQDARTNPDSRYRDWFLFDDSDIGYRTFFGVASLPQVNLANMDARRWMLDIARFWICEFDVDGYRLDHADGPGVDFWSDFWSVCKAEKSDSLCFGEVVDAPEVQRMFYGRMDGILDFHLGDAFRRTYGKSAWSEAELERFMARNHAYFPNDFLRFSFIDNHDMDRFLKVAGGDKAAVKRAAQTQMRQPGPPIIYYGTEIGLQQQHSTTEGFGLHINRVPMVWGVNQDAELLNFYKALIRERRQRSRQVR